MRLRGKAAIITGSARSIGATIARRYTAEGLIGVEEYLAERQSFSRRMNGDDIEGTFVFLASKDSDFIIGQTINVDGGWIMN